MPKGMSWKSPQRIRPFLAGPIGERIVLCGEDTGAENDDIGKKMWEFLSVDSNSLTFPSFLFFLVECS